jgi:Oligoketide cyclase/lipid transport protein
MAEYEQTILVKASPDAVFDFISDVRNMPKYLPTTHRAEPQGAGRVRVQGEVRGHAYDSDGWMRLDKTEHRMEWGSDGENKYSGWMEVEGDENGCAVTVHLSFAPRPDQKEQFKEQTGSVAETIQQGLEAALTSIKNQCEGRSVKVEPSNI